MLCLFAKPSLAKLTIPLGLLRVYTQQGDLLNMLNMVWTGGMSVGKWRGGGQSFQQKLTT